MIAGYACDMMAYRNLDAWRSRSRAELSRWYPAQPGGHPCWLGAAPAQTLERRRRGVGGDVPFFVVCVLVGSLAETSKRVRKSRIKNLRASLSRREV
jgi:hypothetical protein